MSLSLVRGISEHATLIDEREVSEVEKEMGVIVIKEITRCSLLQTNVERVAFIITRSDVLELITQVSHLF